MHFVTCPKQGREMEAVVLHRVGFLAYSCPRQGQDFKPSAAPLYPNTGQEPPPPRGNFSGNQILKADFPEKIRSCMRCGGNHNKSSICPAKEASCTFCGKGGYFQKLVCFKKEKEKRELSEIVGSPGFKEGKSQGTEFPLLYKYMQKG